MLYLDVNLREIYAIYQPLGMGSKVAGLKSYTDAHLNAQFALTQADLRESAVEPDSVEGSFTADYYNAELGTCKYDGAIGGSNSAGTLMIVKNAGTGHHFEVQWPAFPGQWNQSLRTGASGCQPTFNLNPLQGSSNVEVADSTWGPIRNALGKITLRTLPPRSHALADLYFNNAVGLLNLAEERKPPLEAVEELAMASTTNYSDGELYITAAGGNYVESTKSLPEAINASVPQLPELLQRLGPAFGSPTWPAASENVFNSLQAANFKATITKPMLATGSAIIKILRRHKR